MDISSSLLLLARGDSTVTTIFIISIIPFVGKFVEFLLEYFRTEVYLRFWAAKGPMAWNKILLINYHKFFFNGEDYGQVVSTKFIAISNHLLKNNLCTSVNETSIVLSYFEPADCHNTFFCEGVVFDVTTVKGTEKTRGITTITLRSQTKTAAEIETIVKEIVEKYEFEIKEKDRNLLYHFIYNADEYKYTVISDLNKEETTSSETFDNIFNEHKESLVADVDRLGDVDYHQRRGLKRKKGYLFYGEPGCGKTYTVMALANYTKRHIVEIPMSRVKTNADLEGILELKKLQWKSIKKKDVIFLFDEIDCDSDVMNSREHKSDTPCVDSKVDDIFSLLKNAQKDSTPADDKLSLGTILSRLDGISNYDGALFIATTNCIEKLDKALYRHGRLTPVCFDYSRKEDIQAIIEKYFEIRLSPEQVTALPDREHRVSPSMLKCYVQEYDDDLEGLLEFLDGKKN